MKISLLDPGLMGLHGHHFDLDLRLFRALAGRGHEVELHGFARLHPSLVAAAEAAGVTVSATFRVSPYYGADAATPLSPELYRRMARLTLEDLMGLRAADLWFWPSFAPYQFMAAIAQPRPVWQLGGVWSSPRWPLPVGADHWARAARSVHQARGPITVGAYDELLIPAFRPWSPDLPITRLPCPHDGAPHHGHPPVLRRVGFFGHQRPARGLDLLPELASELLARGLEVVIHDSGNSPLPPNADSRILRQAFVADFGAELARCDLVIWPSRVGAYRESHSGVVSECVASGVPIILPSGCLPAGIATRFGTGVLFHEDSCAAILDSVDAARQTYPAVAARARLAATRWHAENGSQRLAAWIEQEDPSGA